MKVLKLFNIFLISITIITSGCSGLEYGKSVNTIKSKYSTIEHYEDHKKSNVIILGPGLSPGSKDEDWEKIFYYIILPSSLLLLGIITVVIVDQHYDIY